jgi:TetR/AcrR family transcriptional regulator, transcriptional repressor of bet genes
LVEDIVRRLRSARTSSDRLTAIVEGNFPEAYFHQNVAYAWLSVCAASATNPDYARLQRIFYRRLASNLAFALKGTLDADNMARLALSVGVQIDGLWLRKSVDPVLQRETAVQIVLENIKAVVEVQARTS